MKADPIGRIKQQLLKLEERMLAETEKKQLLLKRIHSSQNQAANNLVHYLALRNEDIRDLQYDLHIHGLSSLASAESHIHRQLQSILQRLGKEYTADELDSCTYEFGSRQIWQKCRALFGEKGDDAAPYIMVTFDSSFASDYTQVKSLLQSGMNVARINCAHDDEQVWLDMIGLVKKACAETGLHCKIYMDMAGPKIRTALLKKGSKKGKAEIAENGIVWLADNAKGFDKGDVVISPNVPGIISMLKAGERVYIDDG
ncbi:MAG: pyruvate kinase, partial [Mucilaginibacter sp.]